jgi:hypothetical protein
MWSSVNLELVLDKREWSGALSIKIKAAIKFAHFSKSLQDLNISGLYIKWHLSDRLRARRYKTSNFFSEKEDVFFFRKLWKIVGFGPD